MNPVALQEAIEAVMAVAPPARAELVGTTGALGRILAEDLHARADHPSSDVSAMDGYACRSEDTLLASEASPQRLRLVGEAAAGAPFEGSLGPGEAVAISTGAPLPKGSDAIALLEETRREGNTVLLLRPAVPKHVRRLGEDLGRGLPYLRKGSALDPYRLALVAALGHDSLNVADRPRVAVVVTGQELSEPGAILPPGNVFDSNGTLLEALLRSLGATPQLWPRIGDDEEELRTAWESARADLIVTTGGASVGRHDCVRRLLEQEGEVVFAGIAVRPGGPTLLGRWRQAVILALPGNPVAAAVLGTILLEAWCHRATQRSGEPSYFRGLTAVAATPFRAVEDKTCLWLARVENDETGRLLVSAVEPQGSARVAAFQAAAVIAVVPPGCSCEAGSPVRIVPLTAPGETPGANFTSPAR